MEDFIVSCLIALIFGGGYCIRRGYSRKREIERMTCERFKK